MNPSKYIFLLQKNLSYEGHLSFTIFYALFLPCHTGAKHDESIYDTGTKQPGKKRLHQGSLSFSPSLQELSRKRRLQTGDRCRYAGGLSILSRELLPRGIRSLPPDEPIHLNRGTEVAEIAL